jgi:hypothetical protein
MVKPNEHVKAMILGREYNPSDTDLIYHYCSAYPFVEIVSNRSLWLSGYWTMNDELERKWGYLAFNKATQELEKEVGRAFVEQLYNPINASFLTSVVMVSSFSLDGDLLNQWKRYADDGRGFAIGFAPKLMKELPIRHLRVLYDENLQLAELLGNLRHIYKYEESIGFKYNAQFQQHLFYFGGDLCTYKDPAFNEEQEIRLVHMSGFVPAGKSGKIMPLGARDQTGKRRHRPLKIHFRTGNGIVVPYVILDYSNKGALSPIKEIILGPRNGNAVSNIDLFLNTVGVKDVIVRRSNHEWKEATP